MNRGLERALEEAVHSGGLNLSARKLKEFPRTAAPGHDLSDTVQAGERGPRGQAVGVDVGAAGCRACPDAVTSLRSGLAGGPLAEALPSGRGREKRAREDRGAPASARVPCCPPCGGAEGSGRAGLGLQGGRCAPRESGRLQAAASAPATGSNPLCSLASPGSRWGNQTKVARPGRPEGIGAAPRGPPLGATGCRLRGGARAPVCIRLGRRFGGDRFLLAVPFVHRPHGVVPRREAARCPVTRALRGPWEAKRSLLKEK